MCCVRQPETQRKRGGIASQITLNEAARLDSDYKEMIKTLIIALGIAPDTPIFKGTSEGKP